MNGSYQQAARTRAHMDRLQDHINSVVSIFRWLWMTNFAAAAVGLVTHWYVTAAITIVSTLVSLFGAGVARSARNLMKGL